MNNSLSLILSETAQNLQIDRAIILRLKYRHTFYEKNYSEEIPLPRVEVMLDWEKNQGLKNNNEFISYDLANSPLTLYAWENSPSLVNISCQKEWQALNFQQDIEAVFPFPKIKALLIVPMFWECKTLGFLVLENEQSRRWKKSDIETAKWLSLIANLSIINQQTLETVQSEVDKRTTQLNAVLRLKEQLSNRMQNYVKELKRLNEIKDEFIANLSDALKNPLNNMNISITNLKFLLDKNNCINEEKGALYLNILKTECEKEISLINNLLKLQDIKTGNLQTTIEQIFLKSIITEFQQIFNQEWDNQGLTLTVNCDLDFIYLDKECFKLILKELLHNAGKFASANTEVILAIYQQKNQTILMVANIGNQITESEQKQIFQPFYQNKNLTNMSNTGTGLGLALVKSLVENFNGIIAVSSIPCQNNRDYLNTFTITFSELPT